MDDDYLHEAGHVLIARIFSDIFIIEYVTLDLETTKSIDKKSLGGLKGKISKPFANLNSAEHDSLILMMLGGLCADDINNSKSNITSEFYRSEIWTNKISAIRYEGDLELIGRHYQFIKEQLNIEWQSYIVHSMKLLHQIFGEEIVWKAIILLRNELFNSSKKTLSAIQIEEILVQSGFIKWLDENIEQIKSERIKLFEKK